VITNQTINATGRVIGENGGLGNTNGSLSMNVSPSGVISFSNGITCSNKVHLPNVGAAGLHRVGAPSQRITDAMQECIDKLGIRELLTYQPISRYWPFQWYETVIYIGLAVALAAFCVWWVRRRLS
jgi:hypothetical protein